MTPKCLIWQTVKTDEMPNNIELNQDLHRVTLCILMDFPIHIDTLGMGLPILYFKGSQVDVSK